MRHQTWGASHLLDGVVLDDAKVLTDKLQEWEDYYNYHRPHGALDGQTPYQRLRQKTQTRPSSMTFSSTGPPALTRGFAQVVILAGRAGNAFGNRHGLGCGDIASAASATRAHRSLPGGSECHASEARISISAVVAGGSGGSPYVAA
jgi:hypothetical protein